MINVKEGKGNGISGNQGFTLIEMAIVLIIIGIIIGAVVKGKDLVKSAQQKKLYSKYLQGWQLAYNNYYDRTGWILADVNDTDNCVGSVCDGHCSGAGNANLVSQLKAIGLEPPTQGTSGFENRRRYTDSQGNEYEFYLRFYWDADIGNYMRIWSPGEGMSSEVGIAWDRIIDGQRDGTSGDFRYYSDGVIGANDDGNAWGDVTSDPVAASIGVLKLQF